MMWPVPAACQEAPAASQPSEAAGDVLHVQSDKLVSLRESNYIHFIGNVRVSVDTTRIRSGELKVYYNRRGADNQAVSGESIEKIVAQEDVRIDMENRTATCQKAVYRPRDQILVLTGGLVRIKSEGNLISGSRIRFNRQTGEIIVDGDPEQRVNAIIRQGDDGLLQQPSEDEVQEAP
jgi:lipopolysaccharide export system protein LptA